MLSGSDLIDLPQEISNTLTWTGPFTLAAGSALTLLYQVQTPPVDGWLELCNRVEVSATEAIPAPAQACIAVRPKRLWLYLPHVVIGWYETETGERLLLPTGGDSYHLVQVQVE